MILTVTPNPALDVTLYVDGLKPHDTNRVTLREVDAGGKGLNLSRAAAELGARTVATGFLGGGTGAEICHVLLEQGVEAAFLAAEHPTRTNFNIEDGAGPPTTLNAQGAPVSAELWEALKAKVAELSAGADWLCLGGSLPQGLPPSAFAQLTQIGRAAGAKVLTDADGEVMRLALAEGPDLVKPNRKEAERLLGVTLTDESSILAAGREICRLQAEAGAAEPMAMISLGAEGALLCAASGAWLAPAPAIQARSTVGSGDSMLGGFLAALEQGHNLPDCLRWGVAAGAATACTGGAEIVRRPVFEEILARTEVRQVETP
jgi:1-phosphofructokinase family hexose kinase